MKLNLNRPALPLFALSLLAVTGIIVLAALHIAVPDVLTVVAYAGLAGGAGATVPAHVLEPTAVAITEATGAVAVPVAAAVPAVALVPPSPTFPVPPGA